MKERTDAFIKAGKAFSICANQPQLQQKERVAYYAGAGECFVRGHRFKEAGSHFVDAGKYTKAACTYQKGCHFDEMADVLEEHADQIEAKLLAKLTKVAKINYFKVSKPSTIRR